MTTVGKDPTVFEDPRKINENEANRSLNKSIEESSKTATVLRDKAPGVASFQQPGNQPKPRIDLPVTTANQESAGDADWANVASSPSILDPVFEDQLTATVKQKGGQEDSVKSHGDGKYSVCKNGVCETNTNYLTWSELKPQYKNALIAQNKKIQDAKKNGVSLIKKPEALKEGLNILNTSDSSNRDAAEFQSLLLDSQINSKKNSHISKGDMLYGVFDTIEGRQYAQISKADAISGKYNLGAGEGYEHVQDKDLIAKLDSLHEYRLSKIKEIGGIENYNKLAEIKGRLDNLKTFHSKLEESVHLDGISALLDKANKISSEDHLNRLSTETDAFLKARPSLAKDQLSQRLTELKDSGISQEFINDATSSSNDPREQLKALNDAIDKQRNEKHSFKYTKYKTAKKFLETINKLQSKVSTAQSKQAKDTYKHILSLANGKNPDAMGKYLESKMNRLEKLLAKENIYMGEVSSKLGSLLDKIGIPKADQAKWKNGGYIAVSAYDCSACKPGAPALQGLSKDYDTMVQGKPGRIVKFGSFRRNNWNDRETFIANHLGASSFPTRFLIDAHGNVVR